ncbi:hypothetical protein LTR85_004275 [Meristemomyces frigidus]|nr:hypothetical protein LTR85_004275 [Meristemomyces frigidus]
MTSLLARLGQRESRTATQTLWSSSKRKRQDWVCRQCRADRVVVQQRRGYGDDSLRVPVDDYSLFPSKDLREEDAENKRTYNRVPGGREKARPQIVHRSRWGSRDEDARVGPMTEELDDTEDTAETQEEAASWSARGSDRTAPHESEQNALWERFERVEDDGATSAVTKEVADEFEVDTNARTFALHAERDGSLLNLDYAAVLPEALLKREVDLTARCLFAASQANDLDFIRSMDEATFSQVLKVMEPANSIDKLASAHLEISNAMLKQLGIASMQEIAWEYSNVMSEIIAIRRSAGIRLTLDDYAVLLRGARDLGNRRTAGELWKKLQHDGHVPDVDCFNYYMAVVVFDRVHNANGRHKLRIIPFHMLARKAQNRGDAFRGHSVGAKGVKAMVVRAFGEMLKKGAIANEESFRVVMMAAAREGELSTVKSVLRKVWNIDVDALVAGQDEAEIRPKDIPKSSHLYPTSKLLFTFAHAFAINNDIPTALRLVDFVARHYNLTISQEVWSQLFEWTFVLASTRSGAKSREDGTKTGQLPLQSVMNLWETMTAAPYLIKPTMGMYNRLVKNLFYRDMTPAIVEKMNEGRKIYYSSSNKARKLWTRLYADIMLAERDPTLVESLEHLRSEWEYADLIRKRNLFWLKRWLRLLLGSMRTTVTSDVNGDWSLRHIPRLLWEWRQQAPHHVRYETVGGIVEFNTRSQADVDANALRGAGWRLERQETLDKVPRYIGHAWLSEGVGLLPKRMVVPGGEGSSVDMPKYWRKRVAAARKSGERGSGGEGGGGDDATEALRRQMRNAVAEALDRQ